MQHDQQEVVVSKSSKLEVDGKDGDDPINVAFGGTTIWGGPGGGGWDRIDVYVSGNEIDGVSDR